MTNRNLLLGWSKPSDKLTREEIAALDRATVPPRAAEAAWEEGRWPAADGPQGSAQVSLELGVPRLWFQGHRRKPTQARAKACQMRPLQAGVAPGRRVMLRAITLLTAGHVVDYAKAGRFAK